MKAIIAQVLSAPALRPGREFFAAAAARRPAVVQPMPYQVNLPVFEGPLDLLLHLIRVHEIDIYDIPIARLTAEYLAHLELMKALDIDVAGEWIVMAATLAYIKSRTLLPAPPEADEHDEEDPRQELVEKLLEYQRVKAMAMDLKERELEQREVYLRPPAEIPEDEDEEIILDVTLFDLFEAFTALLEKLPADEAHELVILEMSVTERIHTVLERLEGKGPIAFEGLFDGAASRTEVVVTFLALLEMMRHNLILVQQLKPSGPFRVSLAVAEEEPAWS
ncbi:MAG: segregation/condensation protein A [bacterium]|nr:segregation/condensation protein A [bacterium]